MILEILDGEVCSFLMMGCGMVVLEGKESGDIYVGIVIGGVCVCF